MFGLNQGNHQKHRDQLPRMGYNFDNPALRFFYARTEFDRKITKRLR